MLEAETRLSIIGGEHGRNGQWEWYHGCIRQMLRDAGCAADVVDDVAHDFIIGRLDRVFQLYDRAHGRFRPYLGVAVRNYWRDRLRSDRAKGARHQPIDAVDLVVVDSGDAGDDLRVLNLFFDCIFFRYMVEMTKAQVGFVLLRDWCMTGRDLDASIAALQLSISAEYARKVRAEAVTVFATFIESQLSAEDFALMAGEAQRRGVELGIVREARSIAGVFRWPSEKKRLGTVALLLRHLYQKYERQGGSLADR